MNIFELILSDPSSYQQVSNEFSQHNSNWVQFKLNIKTLFSISVNDIQPFSIKSKQLWATVARNNPQLLQIMIEYYQNQLIETIEHSLDKKMKGIAESLGTMKSYIEMEISSYLQAIYELFVIHEKYISIFDRDSHYLTRFRDKLYNQLTKYNVKTKLFALLKQCYQKNSLNVLKSEILQFQENVVDYVKEKSGGSQNFNFQQNKIKKIVEQLLVLGFSEQFFQEFYDFLNKQSYNFITNCVSLTETKDFLTKCLNFQRSFQKHFIKNIKSQKTQDFFNYYLNQLDNNVYYLCAKHCSKNILDIILDFPESLSIILALKRCLDKAPLLNEVGDCLIRQVQKRLLIPGVITQSILNQYINILKVLQVLDPQGIIFQSITLPIKNYLLKRNDTLRCIISLLTDDNQNYSKLTREVVKIPSKQYIEEMSSQQDENKAKEWQDLPVKEQKLRKKVKYQEIDLVTVLVGLYGSQEAFISQYQNMMAQKLMGIKQYNLDDEVQNIQRLKMRFGQSALQVCDIIIKDVKNSKKNDEDVHNKKGNYKPGAIKLNQINCLAVSKGYWPINYENTTSFNVPPQYKSIFDQYAARFSTIKAMRKIFFHYNLGFVNLTLTFDNGDFAFKCLPIQAIMITYLDQDKMKDPRLGISSQQLSNQLQIPQNIIKQKMSFWVHKGVVKETRQAKHGISMRRMNSFEDTEIIFYKPVSVFENEEKHRDEDMDDDFENTLVKEGSSMQSHLIHIIQGLIISILNTNGPKSPEKIHLLLKTVYKTDLDYTYGEAQTTQILKKMLQKKKINFNGQVYSSKES